METLIRRCNGTSRNGEQCKRVPIPGGTVCVMHGGNAYQVRQAANRRLLAGADMAIDYLLGILEPRAPCPTCGRSDADRDPVVVRACQLVMDRAGFSARVEVVHEQKPINNDFASMNLDELIAELNGLAEELTDLKVQKEEQKNAQLEASMVMESNASDDVLVVELDGDLNDSGAPRQLQPGYTEPAND